MEEMEQKSADDQVQAAIEASSPVPESFDQACAWACAACLNAVENGKMKQTMYFNAGGNDGSNISGELGNIVTFSETLCKMFCQAQPLEGGSVRVVLPDVGLASLLKQKWEAVSDDNELPENLIIDYLPRYSGAVEWESSSASVKFVEMLDAEILVVLAPTQTDCPAILRLIEGMDRVGKDIPIVLINPQLGSGTGLVMNQARKLLSTATNSFHLAQYEPDSDDPNMAAGVVSRVWPRPYSAWEDFPEDPDATEGYFLMDLGPRPFNSEEIFNLLEASRDARARLIQQRKKNAAPRARA